MIMKKRLIVFLAIVSAMAMMFGAPAEKGNISNIIASPPSEEAADQEETVRFVELESIPCSENTTLMVYLCGSNLEELCASATLDLLEMAFSGFDTERLNIVVMAGGARGWATPLISPRATGIYQIGQGGIMCLYNDGTVYNMGSPDTLTMFMQYTYDNFPSERYAMILWNHGGGAIGGICNDMITSDALSMQDLAQAFQNSPFAGERKLSWIGFDACMMGSAEVAAIMAPYAEYMIASEEFEPGTGWDYAFLKDWSPEESAAETGKRIAELYIAACGQGGARANYTMSCVDLSQLDAVAENLDGYMKSISVAQDNFAEISRMRRGLLSFGRNEESPDSDYDLIDLGRMVDGLSRIENGDQSEPVQKALKDCVVVSLSTNGDEELSGLTLYFPYYNKNMYYMIKNYYPALTLSAGYADFVTAFGTRLIGLQGNDGTWGAVNNVSVGEVHRDNRTIVSLQLTEKQQAEAVEAELLALQKVQGNEGWRLVATQEASINEYGKVTGEYVHTNLFVTDKDGKPMYDVPLLYVRRDDGRIAVPVMLYRGDEAPVSARLICSLDAATNRLDIETAYIYDEGIDGYSPRLTADIADYDRISYAAEERAETGYDEGGDGPLRPYEEWTVIASREYGWDNTGDWSLRFVRDQLDVKTLAVLYRITDIYNNVYLSHSIGIAGEGREEKVIFVDYDDNRQILIDQSNVNLSPKGILLMEVRNISDSETLVRVAKASIDGTEHDMDIPVQGNGKNGGLKPGEAQMSFIMLPVDGKLTDVDVRLELELTKPDTDEKENMEVRITGRM